MSDHEDTAQETQVPAEVTAVRVAPDSDGGGGITLELHTAESTLSFHLNRTRAAGLFLDFFPPASATCRPCRGTGKAGNGNYCLQCGGSGQA